MSTYDILRRPASYSNHLQRRHARLVSPHMQILARRSGDRDWQPAITQQSAAPQLSRARCRPCVDRRRAHTTTFPTFQGWGCYRTVTGAWPSCPGPTCSLRPVQSLKLTRGSSPRTVLAQRVQLLPRGRLLLVSARRILGRPVDDSLLHRVGDGIARRERPWSRDRALLASFRLAHPNIRAGTFVARIPGMTHTHTHVQACPRGSSRDRCGVLHCGVQGCGRMRRVPKRSPIWSPVTHHSVGHLSQARNTHTDRVLNDMNARARDSSIQISNIPTVGPQTHARPPSNCSTQLVGSARRPARVSTLLLWHRRMIAPYTTYARSPRLVAFSFEAGRAHAGPGAARWSLQLSYLSSGLAPLAPVSLCGGGREPVAGRALRLSPANTS
ncbi:hypothetical protein C8Q76DRAFT_128888 [Earliella scabrosa]|nr:hypothetical protein C8Q76DRAFT_128888 [Earliella scabrosa]